MFVVELRSDAYGNEAFKYPTLKEALQGARRLVRASRKVYAQDGVSREVVLVLGKIGEEEDSSERWTSRSAMPAPPPSSVPGRGLWSPAGRAASHSSVPAGEGCLGQEA